MTRHRLHVVVVVGLELGGLGCRDASSPAPADDLRDASDADAADAFAFPTSPAVIAHRGASGYAPEHTFAAYDLGIEMGADYIEQDVGVTSDGVLVCLHDDTLDRTARGDPESCTGRVSDKTLAQIRSCDVGSWFNEANPDRADPAFVGLRIPTLEEAFERYGATVSYYIETKTLGAGSPMEAELHRLVVKHGLREAAVARRAVVVQSFDRSSLDRFREIDPEVPLVQLGIVAWNDAQLDELAAFAFGVGPPARVTTADLVERAHARGLAVHPYTVNDPADLEALGALCVDGMFTNFPDRYRTVVDRGGFDCPAALR